MTGEEEVAETANANGELRRRRKGTLLSDEIIRGARSFSTLPLRKPGFPGIRLTENGPLSLLIRTAPPKRGSDSDAAVATAAQGKRRRLRVADFCS